LHINVSNIVKATSVLVVDLMQATTTSTIVRSIRLRKIWGALRRCEQDGLVKPGELAQVKDMLALEDKLWRQSRPSSRSIHPSPSLDKQKAERQSSYSSSPVESLSTPNETEINMFSFLPSDSGLYPILQADSNNNEWPRLYESFLDLSNIK
jgi:hypothetical protein